MIRQAVILAGGRGTRLGNLTQTTPKPAISVGGVPFLHHLIWNLARHGVRDIILSTGYLHDRLREVLGDEAFGAHLSYVREDVPLGTGGGLRNCLDALDERFLVLNGDSIFDINYLDLTLEQTRAALALRRVPDTARYGRVDHTAGRVTAFREKGKAGAGAINGGIYFLTREVVASLPEGASSLEQDLFPVLAEHGELACREYSGFFIDIGVPEDLARAQTAIPAWRRKPALFLDRDGVLNVNHGYVHKPVDLTWCPGAREAVKAANDAGWLVVVITNQAGIGRGYYDEATFTAFMSYMQAELARTGAHLDAVYHCPHHPEGGKGEYLRHCDCRKPEPGMLLKAACDWDIPMERSVLVGDSPSDLEAGRRAGVGTMLEFDPKADNLAPIVAPYLPNPAHNPLEGSC